MQKVEEGIERKGLFMSRRDLATLRVKEREKRQRRIFASNLWAKTAKGRDLSRLEKKQYRCHFSCKTITAFSTSQVSNECPRFLPSAVLCLIEIGLVVL